MVDAVIVINTAVGDIPQAVYWWIGSAWFEPADPHDRTATLAALDLGEKAMFPYATAPQIALDLR
ncbi:hypothetical protein L0664_01595 [Octadecabacter sp. G9-8]|uniref:Uncharacterized protein n=1 Tax=Octadecabacter dasysiphoniae TaxID=2909341 RepID=A0ABS9CUN6_9RHOB|nr:hypothetical protein [Octadecabacter dasysiphoniae]MCF2869748.1 hypothetical protein [Octadecabacter dasysiphoniae]